MTTQVKTVMKPGVVGLGIVVAILLLLTVVAVIAHRTAYIKLRTVAERLGSPAAAAAWDRSAGQLSYLTRADGPRKLPKGNGVTRAHYRPPTVSLTPLESTVLRCEEWCQNFRGWVGFKRRNPYVNAGSLASWLARDVPVHIHAGNDRTGMPHWVTFTRRVSTPPRTLEVGWATGG